MGAWWTKEEVISKVADWSYGLQKAHPRQRVLALGQSAAWTVLGVGMIRRLRGQEAQIGFIPFTGAFLERDMDTTSPHMEFNERDLARPPADRLIPYFNLLSAMGAQPHHLAAEPRQVVIAEMIKSGNGLASFLDVLHTPAMYGHDPRHLDHIEIYAYDTNPQQNRDSLKIAGRSKPFHLRRVFLNQADADLMENMTPHNIAEENSSRLVPMYRLSATAEEKGLEIIPNADNRRAIKLALHTEIQNREQEARRHSLAG